MRKNNSSVGFGNSKGNYSNKIVPAPKKVEGFDLRTTLSPRNRQQTVNPNYRTTIESLKNKSRTKDIEDQYIHGLQDQIKFLQYELKLLKDKELQQQSTVEQLGKFFDDGVPLNENILAMKNCFTNQKTQFESQCRNLKVDCKQKTEFIRDVRLQIERLKNVCKKTDSQKAVREDLLVGQIAELTKKMKKYIHQSKLAQDINRELDVRYRKLKEQLATMKLNSQMDGILTKQDVRNGQINVIRVQLGQKDNEIGRLQLEREALRIKVEENTAANQLELENAELKKKILFVTKQINLLYTKVDQAKYECDGKLKEREIEAIQKRDLIAKAQQTRKLIDQENRLTEKDLQTKIAQKEKAEVRTIERKKQSLMKYIAFKKAQSEKLQSETQQILSGKAELQQKLTELTNDVDRLNAKVHMEREKQVDLISSIESLEAARRIFQAFKEPLPTQNSKMSDKLQSLQRAVEKLQRNNILKQKQLQLIKQLKTFNLEELKVIKNTSNNVQESITTFLKKWEGIKAEEV